MKRLLTLAVATALLGLTTNSAQARPDNPTIKNGNPCIEEICLGDEPKDLNHIKWKSFDIDRYKKIYIKAIGDSKAIDTLSYYFGNSVVDAKALKELTKIKGFCSNYTRNVSLKGIYINKKGQEIVAHFDIVPEKDRKKQKFLVTTILKTIYPQRATDEQLKDLSSQVSSKYPGFDEYNAMINNNHYARIKLYGNSTVLRLSSYKYSTSLPNDEYKKFPGCGGDVQIKL